MASAQPPPRPPPPQVSRSSPQPPESQGTTASSSSNQAVQIRTFKDLQKVHDKVYGLVEAGLQADERGDVAVARKSYTKGLELLDGVLRMNCEQLSQSSVDEIDQAKTILQKMNKTRQQVTFRLQALQVNQADGSEHESMSGPPSPPSYDEAMSEPPSLPPEYNYDLELTSLGESLMRREISNSNLASAEELFSVSDGVQIFYITSEGYVSAPTYPTSLHIVRMENEPPPTEGATREATLVFLHVGDWMYPLIPGSSPALHTNYGAYLFPDMMSPEPGAAVGVLIPETLAQEERQKFEDIIRSLTVYGEQALECGTSVERQMPSGTGACTENVTEHEEGEELDTYSKISKGLVVAAEWIAWGLEKGAEKAGELIRKGSVKFREKYSPSLQDHRVDPKVQKGIMYARKATHGAVKVTGYVVNKLGVLTVAIAKQVAPHVKKQGMKILPRSMKSEDPQHRSTVDGIVEVAASGLQGFGTVYISLEHAAKTLGRCLADETVSVVKYRYGEDASNLAENTMYTAGNVIMAAHNASHLGMKAIAKRAAKETGRAVVEDMNSDRTSKSSGETRGERKMSSDSTDKKHLPGSSKE